MISQSTYFLKQEFEKRGYQVTTFDDKFLLLVTKDNHSFYTNASKGPLLTISSYMICRDKYLTRQVLDHFHFPNPKYLKVSQNSIGNLDGFSYPVVVKPLNLEGGEGVEINIQNPQGVLDYLRKYPQYKEVLVEEMLEGKDTRILIVQGKFFAAVQRYPAYVVGDGIHTIKELVEIENTRRQEIFDHDTATGTYATDLLHILFDDESRQTLAINGRKETDILPKDTKVFVRRNENVSTGGTSVDVTDMVGSQIRKECEEIAAALQMSLAGIDIMTKDLSKPLNMLEKSGVVEVNASPGLDLHILTDEGTRRNPVPLIVDEIEAYFQIHGKS